MQTLFGMNIIESNLMPPTRPRMTLTPQLPVSDNFRVEFDKWLLEFFGSEPYILIVSGSTLITATENVVMIRGLMSPNA